MRSIVKTKPSQNGEITVAFTDIYIYKVGKSCSTCIFLSSQICLLTLFAKIKCSRKFPDLQYREAIDEMYDGRRSRFVPFCRQEHGNLKACIQ